MQQDNNGQPRFDLSGYVAPKQEQESPVVSPPVTEESEENGYITDMAIGAIDGARDAVQGTVDFAHDAGATLEESGLNLGGINIGNKASNGVFEYVPPSEWRSAEKSSIQLPDVHKGQMDTIPGQVVHDISQFVTGFLGANKGLGRLGWKGASTKSSVAKTIVAGGVAEGVVFDPRQEGLVDLINKYPVLDGIAPDFLLSNPNDTRAEARLKKTIEGLYWGGFGESLFQVFKAARSFKGGDNAGVEEATKKAEEALSSTREPSLVEPEVTPLDKSAVTEEVEDAVVVSTAQFNEIRSRIKSGESVDEALDGIDFNFKYMESEDSVKQTINAISETLSGKIHNMKGGVRSHEVTESLATALGADENQLYGRMSQMFSDVQDLDAVVVASKKMMQGLSDKVNQLSKIVDSENATPMHEAELLQHIQLLSNVTGMFKGIQTNIARAQNAHKVVTSKVGGAVDMDAVHDYLNTVGGGKGRIRELANKLKMYDGDLALTTKATEKAWHDKVVAVHNEYWINSILSGVDTHVVNMLSNTINSIMLPVERGIGAVVTGDMKGARESAGHVMAMFGSAYDSLKLSGKAFKEGDNVLDPLNRKLEVPDHAISAENFNMKEGSLLAGMTNIAGNAARISSRFLLSEDEFFKQMNYRARMRSRSYTEGLDKGLKGKELAEYVNDRVAKSFDAEGRATDKDALLWSQEATFTRELGEGTFSRSVQKLVNQHPTLRVITPFIRTPTNILRNVWQHTPGINILQKQLMDDIKAGGARKQLAVGKMTTGTSMFVVASMLAESGSITGKDPRDKAERDALTATGWRPYSFVTTDEQGNKTYSPFGRLDPYGMIFGIIADVQQMSDELTDDELSTIAVGYLAATARNVTSKTYMAGISNFISTFESGDPNNFKRFAARQLGSYVPNLLSQTNDDPYMREVRDVTDGILAKYEGGSKTLMPKRTPLGEPVKREKRALPWHLSQERDEPVYKELAALGSPVRHPPKKLGQLELTEFKNNKGQDAYDRYLELHSTIKFGGKTLKQSLDKLIASESYQRLPNDTDVYTSIRLQRIQGIVGRYRDKAKRQLLKEDFTHNGTQAGKGLEEAFKIDQRNSWKVPMRGESALTPLLNSVQ